MEDISSLEHRWETHAVTGLTALTPEDMIKAPVVWACSLIASLLVDSCHAQKLNIHWGPQSMMYLKGKYGRRFVTEENNKAPLLSLHGWFAVLRGSQRLQSLQISRPGHIVISDGKVLVHFLQDR
ncbi:spexin-like isoform X2 [Cynoglossus semilaevis]|uniref:spexin-like isoform X2 n=1 Tax=Cynoglossus semilaevis TaxID=244447 RepID=UPI0007DCAE7F|nr:spexin-like isoform X2 [Cynoglossus semilaevis]